MRCRSVCYTVLASSDLRMRTPAGPMTVENDEIASSPPRSDMKADVTELAAHQAAISKVLRAIANSPSDLQPIFQTILEAATHLCRADGSVLRLVEKEGVRLVAKKASPG